MQSSFKLLTLIFILSVFGCKQKIEPDDLLTSDHTKFLIEETRKYYDSELAKSIQKIWKWEIESVTPVKSNNDGINILVKLNYPADKADKIMSESAEMQLKSVLVSCPVGSNWGLMGTTNNVTVLGSVEGRVFIDVDCRKFGPKI